jgi:hypothetical protein
MRKGVDYSTAKPAISKLKSHGYTFVCRYLSHRGNPKNLSLEEAKAIHKAGLSVVSNWEVWGDWRDYDGGFASGQEHARKADAMHRECGGPPGRPIYFSVDWEASDKQLKTVAEYFKGVVSVIGVERTGAYGGTATLKYLFDRDLIRWGWQTQSWWKGLEKRAHIRQRHYDVAVAGGSVDVDEALAEDFGQWDHGTTTTIDDGGLAVARNSDGRLEVCRVKNGTAQHIWQQSTGGWGGWASLGGVALQNQIAVGANADTRLELFAVGGDGKLYHKWQLHPSGADGWSDWSSLGGADLHHHVGIGMNTDGRMELFVTGGDALPYHLWQLNPNAADGWSGWAALGHADLQPHIGVGVNADGRLELFAVDDDGHLRHAWQHKPDGTGGWSDWASLGGTCSAGSHAVARNADGRLEVFAVDQHGRLNHIFQTDEGGWGDWASLGGSELRAPVAAVNADGRIEVIAIGGDGHLYHIWQAHPSGAGGWSGWALLGGSGIRSVTVGTNGDGRLEVFGVDEGGALGHTFQTAPNASWSKWQGIGKP